MPEKVTMLNRLKTLVRNYQQARNEKRAVEKQLESLGSVCFCPRCARPLLGFSKSTSDYGIYQYTCVNCQHVSLFDFASAPVPLLVHENKESNAKNPRRNPN